MICINLVPNGKRKVVQKVNRKFALCGPNLNSRKICLLLVFATLGILNQPTNILKEL